MQSKRELFFKNDVSSNNTNTGIQSAVQPNSNSTTPVPHQNSVTSLKSNQSTNLPTAPMNLPRVPVVKGKNHIYLYYLFYFFDILFVAESSTDPLLNKENLLKTDLSGNGKSNERKVKKLDGYVGFANLPNQVYRKAVKKGFEFTLMVVGKPDTF